MRADDHAPGAHDRVRAPLTQADDYTPVLADEAARDEARHVASVHWRYLVGRWQAAQRQEAALLRTGDVRILSASALRAGSRRREF
ncbi:MAG TPA: hypothetical protein VGD56_19185 [Gemmatirosa sp.]